MSHTYLRVPRVHRLEYLDALLHSYNGDDFDEAQARQAIQREIQDFESKKAKALRRQRPRQIEGRHTLEECLELAMQLNLLDRNRRLRPKAAQVLDPAQRRSVLLQSLWQAYPRFGQIVLRIRDNGPLELPLYNWDDYRKAGKDLHGLDMDRRNFETIRDFSTQLGLVNWYPTENSHQVTYPTACVATQAEIMFIVDDPAKSYSLPHDCQQTIRVATGLPKVEAGGYSTVGNSIPDSRSEAYLVLQTDSERVFIIDHSVTQAEFEQTLWREYLRIADMIPMSPVLYPTLRNQVCAALQITDKIFDRQLTSLIRGPQRLNIHPSDGTLNYSANLAHLGKFLPPQTSEGNFIVYLKLERRSS